MKKMKTKIATALVLGAISFGMFSFTTTPINAQVTTSVITVEAENEEAALPAVLVVAFVRGVVAGAVVGLAYRAYTYLTSSQAGVNNYPSNALD